ncbi:ABC transporter substrate-binding protein [Conexibacter sp. JD483]|uniref:ABC transporter substrate-binding protein n=1 Tax=unclassified Conexibacter TaxID=2627773 RepID=UPI002720DB08|nr:MULTISPECIES: ABC transporter substrate-binding protein [unclassified Conexibacter]MDO8186016.1 ABC transporter substrate-binding protein [Conexibacter sp. CPCC 205706]MDO8199506.1 ABC transporter substrate-binding protein [Conexibacter sp. CPCC 205762]MDR9368959.1 ABC transporter substrate-binding protein [Conexibacter sp. JD483]
MVAALLAAVTFAACGSSDSDESSGSGGAATSAAGDGGGELTSVKIGVVPAATFAPIFVGVEQGFFRQHGIDLQLDVGGLAPTVFPRILKGELQLGANTWGTLVTAKAQNLPLTGIAPVDSGGTTAEDDYQGIVAAPGGVRDLSELEGKTVAVPTLKSFTDSQVKAVLRENGVDVSKVRFTALPFPDMPAALKAGRVDAAGVVEPFMGQIVGDGGTLLAPLSRGQLMGAIVASEKWVEDNRETVANFDAAWQETLDYADRNPDAVRRALVTGLRLPEAVAQRITLPIWVHEIDEAKVQEISDMMLETGAITEPVPASSLITPFPLAP